MELVKYCNFSVHVVTPSNFIPQHENKLSQLKIFDEDEDVSDESQDKSEEKETVLDSEEESDEAADINESQEKEDTGKLVEVTAESSKESEESSEESGESEEEDESIIKDNSHWSTLSSFKLSDGLKVTKYRSNLTGLTVVLASADSPIVNGYFCLATEVLHEDFISFFFSNNLTPGAG